VSPNDILRQAAAVLESKGWCQGMMHGIGGTCCMLGAITTAAWAEPHDGHAVRRIAERERACTMVVQLLRGRAISEWNDEPGRTKEQVVAKLLEAASLVEEAP